MNQNERDGGGAASINDERWSAGLGAAEAASAAGDWASASARWDALRAQFPGESLYWSKAGEAYRMAGLVTRADEILAIAVEHFPEDLWIAHQYTFVAQQRADWPQALARAQQLRQKFPEQAISQILLGEAYQALGRLDEAETAFADGVERFPTDEWLLRRHAQLAEYRGEWRAALARWTALLTAVPGDKSALVGRDQALRRLDRVDEADAVVDDVRSAVISELRQQRVEEHLPARLGNPQVLIEITSICNFACSYCVSPMKLRDKKQMSLDTFRRVMDEVATITTNPIRLHIDGEPTSHPQFKEMALLVNSYGLPVWLATNGSYLDPSFLEIWMDPLISMSTLPEELAKRHSKLNFDAYIARIARYTAAWAISRARQNLVFQIIHYPQPDAAAEIAYRQRKDAFLAEFCRRSGLYDTCSEETSAEDENYRLRRNAHPGWVQFLKQPVLAGGLYPDEGKMVARPRATTGFCDSPWRQLVIHSDGSLGACCVDLSGGTTFASAAEAAATPLKQLWQSSPRLTAMRESFRQGRVELDVCQRCLSQGQVTFPASAE